MAKNAEQGKPIPDETVKTIVKQKQKQVRRKRPDRVEELSMHTEPGEMSKMILDAVNLSQMGEIDINDSGAVAERVNQYLTYCIEHDMKPTVESMALAFNTNRVQLWRWKEGVDCKIPEASRKEIKKCYSVMNQLMTQAMANGKINPVAAIFLLKNNHNYKDQTDVVVAPASPYESGDPDEVRKKYLEDVPEIQADGDVK